MHLLNQYIFIFHVARHGGKQLQHGVANVRPGYDVTEHSI